MRKKGFLIVVIVILLFTGISFSVDGAGCCVYSDSCSEAVDENDCTDPQYYSSSICQQVSECDYGCCCKPGDLSVNGFVFTNYHCGDISGTSFEYMGAWSPSYTIYINICKAKCGENDIACTADYVCSDGSTVIATCEAGVYVPTANSCPSTVGGLVDTDGDGVYDINEECPNEIMLTSPSEPGQEITCDDGIDNDCDGVKDCYDPDCCVEAGCASNQICIMVTCGNGNVDAGEECDDGNTVSGDGCSNICRDEECGDGIVQPALDEECDDGNDIKEDGCENNCTLSGDIVVAFIATECNDGIDNDGDGCFDWPFDRGCNSESDEEEGDVTELPDGTEIEGDDPRQCTICGDNMLDTPNSQGFYEDCDGTGCGNGEFPTGECNNDCTCSYQCLSDPGAPVELEILSVRGQFANLLTWQMHPNLGCTLDKIYIYRCLNEVGNVDPCVPDEVIIVNESTGNNFYYHNDDYFISADTTYCYRVDAYYTTGASASSDVVCITTGDILCMASDDEEFCRDNVQYMCGDYNNGIFLENCSGLSTVDPDDFICAGPFDNGLTQCLYQSECNLCNGLFELFALEATAIYDGPLIEYDGELGDDEGEGTYPCSIIPTCYNDTTRTTINKYQSCVDINNCYDYTSESACVENRCQLGECEWASSYGAFKELGVGVCKPVSKQLQNCTLCGTLKGEAQNRFYGDCDVETCKLYGDCYYSYGKCGGRKESGCWSYATEEDCIGGDIRPAQEVDVDVQWEDDPRIITRFYVFVTSWLRNGDLLTAAQDELGKSYSSGLDAADALCQAEADAERLPGTYKAWLSDSTTDAAERLTHSTVPYVLVDGTLVANDWTDLVTCEVGGSCLKNPINKDASGDDVVSAQVWTGTGDNGVKHLETCLNWEDTTVGGIAGNTAYITPYSWTHQTTVYTCSANYHLYCFQQDADTKRKVSDTNKIIDESHDYFNFSVCKWVGYEGKRVMVPSEICVKDADNNSIPDCIYGVENKACQIDSIPAKTTFILDNHPVYDDADDTHVLLPKKIDLQYHTTERAQVYFCIGDDLEFAIGCYPNETSMCGLQKTFEGDSGYYGLYYFAEDNSHNLENVSYLAVYIDADDPVIQHYATNITGDANGDIIEVNGNPNDNGNDVRIVIKDISQSPKENLRCSGMLVKGNGVPTRSESIIEFEIDEEFTRDYYNLADDIYYFDYECSDYAGNIVSDKIWFGVDMNKIHNPEPFGPQDDIVVDISVDTEENVTCRYARYTGSVPGWESMSNFGSVTEITSGFEHKSTLILSANNYYEYIVKCSFSDGMQGNDNDRIRFSIDKKGPSIYAVTTFEAYDFDVSKTWGTEQEIRLQCRDNYFESVKKVLNMDFGCKEEVVAGNLCHGKIGPLLYNYRTDDYVEMCFDKETGISEDYILIENTGVHIIEYQMNDTADNTAFDHLIIRIDNREPVLDVAVYPYPIGPGSKPLDPISYGNYVVKVNSTKSLNDINMSLVVDTITMPWSYMYSEDFGKTHYFLMRIPYPEEGGLAKGTSYFGTIAVTGLVKMPGSVCSFEEADEETLIGIAGKDIEINTNDPEIVIEPALDDFESIGYPLRREGDIYYTNESMLFITGRRENSVVNEVWFYVLNGDDITVDMASPQKIYMFDSGKNVPAEEPLNTEGVSVTLPYGEDGSYTLNVVANVHLTNVGMTLATGQEKITNEKYIEIIGKERGKYGHHRGYYKVDKVKNMGGGIWKLTLTEMLETDLGSGDKINIYSAPFPYDLFGEYIDLEAGNNTFYARARSASGIMPPYTGEPLIIFTDPNPPVVISQTPGIGTTNNLHATISIVVREAARESLVDKSSIKLLLNNEEITEANGLVINEYNISSFIYYEIMYQPPEPLDDGTYKVEFKGKDNAGHDFACHSKDAEGIGIPPCPAWDFKVDIMAPSTPVFKLANGTFFNGIWYINRSPGFSLEFTDENWVNITSIYKDQPYAGFNLGHKCDYTSNSIYNNLFECVFNPKLEPLQIQSGNQMFVSDTFQIIVEAYKTLINEEKSPKGLYYLDQLVIDNITPEISKDMIFYPKRIKVDGEIEFKVYVNNEFHDLNATLIPNAPYLIMFSGAAHYPLEQMSKLGTQYKFKWMVPYYDTSRGPDEVNQNFTLKIADYAGNENTITLDDIIIDLKIPSIENIHVSVMPTVEQFGGFRTRHTIIIVNGTFEDDDITDIFIIPGSYIPGQEIYEEVSQSAHIFGHEFMVEMQINGTVNKTILNMMSVFLVDEAGYQVFIPLNVIADLEPPSVIASTVT